MQTTIGLRALDERGSSGVPACSQFFEAMRRARRCGAIGRRTPEQRSRKRDLFLRRLQLLDQIELFLVESKDLPGAIDHRLGLVIDLPVGFRERVAVRQRVPTGEQDGLRYKDSRSKKKNPHRKNGFASHRTSLRKGCSRDLRELDESEGRNVPVE